LPMYGEAAVLTLRLGGLGILLALLTGLVCSLIRLEKVPVLSQLVRVYTELSRNTPLLVQLFFLYFGLPKLGLHVSSETCAVLGLTFLGGSYMAEAFRAGLEGVAFSQQEAAAALGFTRWQSLRLIIIPQALATSIPALGANVIFLLKETSVFSVVALADLVYVAKDIIGLYYKTDEALLLLVVAYLLILLPISLGAAWLERRLRYGEFGA
ncbi:MAG: amino acid ABC transporter permease, partial [Acidaminococcaceae bacterium]|nr:amino acid ABC transporter permease [Acidaminococcaceae bacterium]